MERNREAKSGAILRSNGRRRRTSGYRESPGEEGGAVELQESVKRKDRVNKNREREREKSGRIKRKRGDRLMTNREDTGGDGTSEESVNDEDEEISAVTTGGVRLLFGSISNHHRHSTNQLHSHSSCLSTSTHNSIVSNNHLRHVKSYPPGFSSSSSSSSKVFRASPVWKSGDEMTSVSVPRKARSASTKRSKDQILRCGNNNEGVGAAGGQRILRLVLRSQSSAAQMSPSSSNVSSRKKLKTNANISGPKLKPPKTSAKLSSSNPDELEIEIAEVLYGLRTLSQGPALKVEDEREVNKSNSDLISTATCENNQISESNSRPLQAPKRKRPRNVVENLSYGARNCTNSGKCNMDQTPKSEIFSLNLEKMLGSTAENGVEVRGNSINSRRQVIKAVSESRKLDLKSKPVAEELTESRDLIAKGDMSLPKENESPAVKIKGDMYMDLPLTLKANPVVSEAENHRNQEFEIDLKGQKLVVSKDLEHGKGKDVEDRTTNIAAEERKGKGTGEGGSYKGSKRSTDLQFDLGKLERNGNTGINAASSKLQQQTQQKQQQPEIRVKANKEYSLMEKSSQSKNNLPLLLPMAGWPGGLPPLGYMAPTRVVSMDGSTVTTAPVRPLFSQSRPKRCATHCYIAWNIQHLQQFIKINPFWQAAGSNSCNPNFTPSDPHRNMVGRGLNRSNDKGHTAVRNDKVFQTACDLPQQAALARLSSVKSASTTSSSASGSATTMLPGLAVNQTQYLAILQNNGYPYPIPQLGALPNNTGTPAQAMLVFNGSFYHPQMTQLQHTQTAQNHAIFQSFPEANRHNIQMKASPKQNFRASGDEKSCGIADESKSSTAKTQGIVGQSVTTAAAGPINFPNSHVQQIFGHTYLQHRASNAAMGSEIYMQPRQAGQPNQRQQSAG